MSFDDRSFLKILYIVTGSLAGLGLISLFLANLIGGPSDEEIAQIKEQNDQRLLDMAARTVPMQDLTVASAGVSSAAGETLSGAEIYEGKCSACHAAGVAGAPKLESAAWDARVDQGFETVVSHAINGFQGEAGNMPAKGGHPDLTDDDIQRTVAYMLIESGHESAVPADARDTSGGSGDQEAGTATSTETATETTSGSEASTSATQTVSDANTNQQDSSNTTTISAADNNANSSSSTNTTDSMTASTTQVTKSTNTDNVSNETSETTSKSSTETSETNTETSETNTEKSKIAQVIAAADLAKGQSVYESVCSVCHISGAAGAPQLEASLWTERLAKGYDTLYENVINGYNAMPPRGGVTEDRYSDADIQASLAYMLSEVSAP